jgi:stringent starvation protein B
VRTVKPVARQALHRYPFPVSEQSAKPYLIRAICEWCADNGLTPYMAVKVNAQTRVPASFVKNGEIVLNISRGATRKLTIDNEWVQFTARFNGASQEVSVPMGAIAGIFAKESGYGFAFAVPAADPVSSLVAATAPMPPSSTDDPGTSPGDDKPRSRPKHLQVVK